MPGKLYVTTWGCQMNDYDSQRLIECMELQAGFQQVEEPASADVLVLNTCSIREKAQEKLFHQLGQWRRLKLENPSVIIAVGGCVAVQEGMAIRKRAPYVDILFGPQTLHRLPDYIQQFQSARLPLLAIEPEGEMHAKFDALPMPQSSEVVASVTIMEGCDKFCTYCVVPMTRGAEFCRDLESILKEVRHRLNHGAREVVLLGQNVNAWKSYSTEGKTLRFSDLLRCLAREPHLKRLRFLTSHPLELSDDLIQAFAECPQLSSFLHLPLQSGSDRILRAMARGYSMDFYADVVTKLKSIRKDLVLSSDFIVGFPGETESEFQATLEWAQALDFDISYSFIYSKRPNTPAALMKDAVPHEEKLERLHRLQRVLSQNVLRHSSRWLGQTVEVLVEKALGPNRYLGRTPQNRWVRLESNEPCVGQCVQVKLLNLEGSFLAGLKKG